MRERLYPWNGRVDFKGRSGLGTVVTVHLPLGPAQTGPKKTNPNPSA
jgi:hypothetical protein